MSQSPDQVQVVGDEQQAQTQTFLQVCEQVDDLGLDAHIERRGRLVRDQERGFEGKGRAMPTRWRWPPLSSCG